MLDFFTVESVPFRGRSDQFEAVNRRYARWIPATIVTSKKLCVCHLTRR